MIFHVSIEAEQPRKVAEVIAEIWQGVAQPIDRLVDGAWIAFCGDNHLSAVEVFPQGTDITEAEGYDGFKGVSQSRLRPTATHVALAAKLPQAQIEAIAAREGWRTKVVSRGDRFRVIEMWINDYHLLEWLTPEMQLPYDNTVQGMLAAIKG